MIKQNNFCYKREWEGWFLVSGQLIVLAKIKRGLGMNMFKEAASLSIERERERGEGEGEECWQEEEAAV